MNKQQFNFEIQKLVQMGMKRDLAILITANKYKDTDPECEELYNKTLEYLREQQQFIENETLKYLMPYSIDNEPATLNQIEDIQYNE